MIREPIAVALFNKLSAVAQFKTTSRRLVLWSDVPASMQPALYVVESDPVATQRPGLGPVWEWRFDVHVYVNTGDDPDTPPGTLMNPILDAIEAALAPDNLVTNKQTLGGLVQHCWIEGKTQTDQGVLGGQGVAIIPVFIKVA